MKNRFLKTAVRFAQTFIPQATTSHRFLVVSTTALGDTLWATPAIENLRKTFPNAYIAVLTAPIGLQVFKHNPHIDQLHLLKEPLLYSFFPLRKTLLREKFDTVLLFHASQRLTLPLCALIGARRIIGSSGINKGLDALLTSPLPLCSEHEIVRRLKITEEVGAKTETERLSFYLAPEEKIQLPKALRIAIHPGSQDGYKRLPVERFIAIGKRLREEFPHAEILVTGSQSELPLMEEIASQISGAVVGNPKQSLRAFAALLEETSLLISNDTGPVHLACALNRPVIAFYSPTDPKLCGPHLAPQAIALSQKPTCIPCLKRKCRVPFCFLQFRVEEVIDAAKKLLYCVSLKTVKDAKKAP